VERKQEEVEITFQARWIYPRIDPRRTFKRVFSGRGTRGVAKTFLQQLTGAYLTPHLQNPTHCARNKRGRVKLSQKTDGHVTWSGPWSLWAGVISLYEILVHDYYLFSSIIFVLSWEEKGYGKCVSGTRYPGSKRDACSQLTSRVLMAWTAFSQSQHLSPPLINPVTVRIY
jgi:hypothetical protein